MTTFKYILFLIITMNVYALLSIGIMESVDFLYLQFYKAFKPNDFIHEFFSIFNILEFILFIPITLWLSHQTSKGIAIEGLSPWMAFKESIINLKLKFSVPQRAEK